MKITKLGHCCLLLEHEGKKFLTDPGSWTLEEHQLQTGLDGIIITHEHADHLHVESVNILLRNNPEAEVITNASVAKILQMQEELPCTVVGDGESATVRGVLIEGFGKEHARIYEGLGSVENTGYLVAEKFYFPGDAFHKPGKQVDVLALPVAGPWMKISEALDFALEVKPRIAIPVHDGMQKPDGIFYPLFDKVLAAQGLQFVSMVPGETKEF